MPRPRKSGLTLILGLLPLIGAPLVANETSSPFGTGLARSISETRLPFTASDSQLDIEIRPKLADLVDEPYVRFPVELEYGFTPKLEGSLGYIPYLRNPFDDDSVSSDGYFTYGLKQRIDAMRDDRLAIAVGFDARIPLDYIPSDWARDNYNRYTPYFVAAYEIDRGGEWTIFSNFSHEILDKDHYQLETPPDTLPSLSAVTTGVLHHPPGDLRYGLRLQYYTEHFGGGDNDALAVIPSVTWYPAADTPVFRSIAGHFELTLDLEYSLSKLPEKTRDSDLGVSLDVRWRLVRKIERAKHDVVR